MNDKRSKIALVLATLALVLALGCTYFIILGMLKKQPAPPAEEEGDIQYVLYLGTNDKDTNKPVFEPEEAKTKLKGILIDFMGGYTIQDLYGRIYHSGCKRRMDR